MNWLKPLCPVCGSPTERGFRPCRSCGADMEQRRTEACSLCGAELAGGADPCRACRERNSPGLVERVVALGYWRGPLREWLSIYKYGGDSRMAVFLIEGLASVIRNEWPERTVVRFRRAIGECFGKALIRSGFCPPDCRNPAFGWKRCFGGKVTVRRNPSTDSRGCPVEP